MSSSRCGRPSIRPPPALLPMRSQAALSSGVRRCKSTELLLPRPLGLSQSKRRTEQPRSPGDAFRFLHGTPNIPGLYAARPGYEIIAEIGVERIREKSVQQTARLITLAENAGFRVNSPRAASERGGTVVIEVPNGAEVTRELARRNFLVDYRPGAGVRVAPHFYSTDEELDLTLREMQAIVRELAVSASASGLPH